MSTQTDQPSERNQRASRGSVRPLTIRFIDRGDQLESARKHLGIDKEATGKGLIVRGDSGTGKTFFVRELMRRIYERHPEALFLYVDVANDGYQSSRTLASLLKLSLVAGPMAGTSTVSVPERLSLQRYRRHAKQRVVGRGFLRAVASALGAALGAGGTVGAALGGGGLNDETAVEGELVAYLSWVAKRNLVFVAVDNLQFLNLDVRLTLESILQRVNKNMRLIAIDRTINGSSEIDPPPRCFSGSLLTLTVDRLTAEETKKLIAGAIELEPRSLKRLADDIYSKTHGLAKDVEYCLRKYSLELGPGAHIGAIEGLLTTIDRLPLIHRQFLIVAALLDGGVKIAIARGTVGRLLAARDSARLDAAVNELVARDYLRINSESGDRLRPGHERIIVAIRDLADDDLQEEVRQSLVNELASSLDAPGSDESETYLLHCLVGLQTARELTRNIHYISRLIQSQHRQDQFSYLATLAGELQDILPLLPEHVLNDLLDAMQKSSAFEQGLQTVRMLDSADVPGMSGRRIHRLKYLTQAYRYDEALSLSNEIGEKHWGAVYRVNALMALDRDDEARAIVDAHITPEMTECQAVLRRNTITLFEDATALRHLDEAYRYFEPEQSAFRLATVDTNRSLVHLNAGRLGDALRCLDRAIGRMLQVGSPEIFQAQLNLAIRFALIGDDELALATLDEAQLRVPRSLLLDQMKIELCRTVMNCVGGSISASECELALRSLELRIRGVQMPYLHQILKANISATRGERPDVDVPHPEWVSLTVDLERGGTTWKLPMSVHWRY